MRILTAMLVAGVLGWGCGAVAFERTPCVSANDDGLVDQTADCMCASGRGYANATPYGEESEARECARFCRDDARAAVQEFRWNDWREENARYLAEHPVTPWMEAGGTHDDCARNCLGANSEKGWLHVEYRHPCACRVANGPPRCAGRRCETECPIQGKPCIVGNTFTREPDNTVAFSGSGWPHAPRPGEDGATVECPACSGATPCACLTVAQLAAVTTTSTVGAAVGDDNGVCVTRNDRGQCMHWSFSSGVIRMAHDDGSTTATATTTSSTLSTYYEWLRREYERALEAP